MTKKQLVKRGKVRHTKPKTFPPPTLEQIRERLQTRMNRVTRVVTQMKQTQIFPKSMQSLEFRIFNQKSVQAQKYIDYAENEGAIDYDTACQRTYRLSTHRMRVLIWMGLYTPTENDQLDVHGKMKPKKIRGLQGILYDQSQQAQFKLREDARILPKKDDKNNGGKDNQNVQTMEKQELSKIEDQQPRRVQKYNRQFEIERNESDQDSYQLSDAKNNQKIQADKYTNQSDEGTSQLSSQDLILTNGRKQGQGIVTHLTNTSNKKQLKNQVKYNNSEATTTQENKQEQKSSRTQQTFLQSQKRYSRWDVDEDDDEDDDIDSNDVVDDPSIRKYIVDGKWQNYIGQKAYKVTKTPLDNLYTSKKERDREELRVYLKRTAPEKYGKTQGERQFFGDHSRNQNKSQSQLNPVPEKSMRVGVGQGMYQMQQFANQSLNQDGGIIDNSMYDQKELQQAESRVTANQNTYVYDARSQHSYRNDFSAPTPTPTTTIPSATCFDLQDDNQETNFASVNQQNELQHSKSQESSKSTFVTPTPTPRVKFQNKKNEKSQTDFDSTNIYNDFDRRQSTRVNSSKSAPTPTPTSTHRDKPTSGQAYTPDLNHQPYDPNQEVNGRFSANYNQINVQNDYNRRPPNFFDTPTPLPTPPLENINSSIKPQLQQSSDRTSTPVSNQTESKQFSTKMSKNFNASDFASVGKVYGQSIASKISQGDDDLTFLERVERQIEDKYLLEQKQAKSQNNDNLLNTIDGNENQEITEGQLLHLRRQKKKSKKIVYREDDIVSGDNSENINDQKYLKRYMNHIDGVDQFFIEKKVLGLQDREQQTQS